MDSAKATPQHPADPAPKVFDLSKPPADLAIAEALKRITAETGRSPMSVMRDVWTLSRGPGKLTFGDYVKYRLFDPTFYGSGDPKTFYGQRANHALMLQLNYRHDWFAVLNNKLAFQGYMAAFGLPVIETQALFAPDVALAAKTRLLRSPKDIVDFLLTTATYPLFGKPVEGVQSLGSLALQSCDAKTGTVASLRGDTFTAAVVAEEIATHFRDGFMFQPMHGSPADSAAVIGPRLSTVRVITVQADDGPKIYKAAWKIPTGGNIADNYWRAGNLLAALNADDGAITAVSVGTGLDFTPVTRHPDTGADLIGVLVPHWDQVRAIALAGARALNHFGLLGWDIGIAEHGPVIVEANEAPDLTLIQVAARAGCNDAEIQALSRRQRDKAAQYTEVLKQEARAL